MLVSTNEVTDTASTTASTSTQIEIVLADANRLNAESLSWCLKAYGTFRSVESLSTADAVMHSIRMQRPGVVVLGERIVMDVIREMVAELAVRLGETRLAVFGDNLTDRQLDLVVNNRITGVLSRQDSMRTINEQLVRVAAGSPVLSERLARRLTLNANGSFQCLGSSDLKKLTDRQWDVLLRIAEGRRVAEVAADLHISQKAVESHKYRIMKTLGASDRVDLCRWAIREGLIDA